jgi:carbonic anhydrase/acetyltransferase-like protein (isoleucine patch superfamily)
MALIKSIRGYTPVIGRNCYLADNATIIGEVVIGDDCSVWFNTVIRGDVNGIFIGNTVNIQDGSILHCLYQKSIIRIGDRVSIGHNVIIHGAEIKENALIGMGSILLDHCIIGENSIIAAGSVVLEGTVVPPGCIYGGIPARHLKDVEAKQTREMIERIAENYIKYAGWYMYPDEHGVTL